MMRRNVCKATRTRLPLLVGGELLGIDRREVERHVIGCNDCRRHLESLRNALQVLQIAAQSAPVRPDAPSIWPELSRQIRESRRPVPASWASRFAWPAAGMAATLLLAVGTVIASRPWPSQRLDAPVVHKKPQIVVRSLPVVAQNDPPAESDDSSPDPEPPRRDSPNRSKPVNRPFSDPADTQLTH
jgi:anti-sigma factor RsiW